MTQIAVLGIDLGQNSGCGAGLDSRGAVVKRPDQPQDGRRTKLPAFGKQGGEAMATLVRRPA